MKFTHLAKIKITEFYENKEIRVQQSKSNSTASPLASPSQPPRGKKLKQP